MKRKISDLLSRIRADQHLLEVMRGASSALMIRSIGTVLGFAVSVVIARMLGAEGSGVYYLALSVATIAATVSRCGFDNTVVRFIAAHASVQEWGAVKFVYRTAMKVVVVVSLIISAVLFIGADWLANALFGKPYMELPLKLVSVAVLPLSLAMIQAESLRGLKNIRASQWIKTVLTSLGTILLIYPLVGLMGTAGSVAAFVIAASVTAFVAWLMWKSAWQGRCVTLADSNSVLSTNALFRSSWPLFGVALTGLVVQQVSTIYLGAWGDAVDVGLFNVANRVANLLLFPLMAIISILTPKFASMFKQDKTEELARLARSSSKILTMFVLPVAIFVAVQSEWILSFFGSEFKEGATILRILLIGVAINAATGAVAELLMMCGHESTVRTANAVGMFIVVIGGFLLVPLYGGVGAAIAVTTGYVTINVLMAFSVWKKLGFSPIGFI